MNRLPQEIYDKIAACFSDTFENGPTVSDPNSPFKRYTLATVSRQWQTATERQTFQQIYLKSTDLQAFKTIVRGDRRHFLRCIHFAVVLPRHDVKACARFERAPDRLVNDEAFTTALQELFSILSSWDDGRSCKESNFSVQLDIPHVYSPMDYGHRLGYGSGVPAAPRARLPEDGGQGPVRDLGYRRYQYSYLQVLRPTDLPLVPAIKGLQLNRMGRHISHEAAIVIASKLPNVSTVDCYMYDSERRYPALRRAVRARLTRAVQIFIPRIQLREIRLFMEQRLIWDHSWRPADLRPPGTTHDPLCTAIRDSTAESKALTSLYVRGTLDASLLWPMPSPVTVRPFWQNLEHLNIQFHMTTPSGAWYFRAPGNPQNPNSPIHRPPNAQMPPGYGADEEDDIAAAQQYSESENSILSGNRPSVSRLVPNEELLNPLIEAFARACLQISTLKTASLNSTIAVPFEFDGRRTSTRSEWGVWFAVPCASFPWRHLLEPAFQDDTQNRRLIFDTKHWQPNEHISNLLREIGRERYGTELVERHVDSGETQGVQIIPGEGIIRHIPRYI